MSDTKQFPLRVVLSASTGRLLTKRQGPSDNGISDLYDIYNWLTDDNLFTHQLPRAYHESKPWLLRWFPELRRAEEGLDAFVRTTLLALQGKVKETDAAIEEWLSRAESEYGLRAAYDVPRIPRDDHERKDAYDELVAMRGTDEGIIVVDATKGAEQ